MKNFISEGNTIDIVLAAAASSGDLIEQAAPIYAVAKQDGAIGETIVGITAGVVGLAYTASEVYVQGEPVWPNGAGGVTNVDPTATDPVGNVFTGQGADAPSGVVPILLNGNPGGA